MSNKTKNPRNSGVHSLRCRANMCFDLFDSFLISTCAQELAMILVNLDAMSSFLRVREYLVLIFQRLADAQKGRQIDG